MFNILKKKEIPFNEIRSALIDTATAIIDASKSSNNNDVAVNGMIAVVPFIVETKKQFGIDMHPDSSFARYIKFCVNPQNLDKMAEETRGQALTLQEYESDEAKASLVYMWYTGERPSAKNDASRTAKSTSTAQPEVRRQQFMLYDVYDEWLYEVKRGAWSTNTSVSFDHVSKVIDSLDSTPLHRAFNAGGDPFKLGVLFCCHFDITKSIDND